jgi:hypothetical protein
MRNVVAPHAGAMPLNHTEIMPDGTREGCHYISSNT